MTDKLREAAQESLIREQALVKSIEYEKAQARKYFELYTQVCETAQLRLKEIARLESRLAEQPAEQERDGAMNALCKMFHHGEEVESDDGMAMLVPLDLWHDAIDALDSLIGDEETAPEAPEAPQPAEQDDYKAWYEEVMCASNEAGFVGLDAAQTIRELARQLTAAPPPAKREPLTDEQMGKIINAHWGVSVWEMARAIERTHGIGEQP